MKKLILPVFIALALTSCDKEAMSSNADVDNKSNASLTERVDATAANELVTGITGIDNDGTSVYIMKSKLYSPTNTVYDFSFKTGNNVHTISSAMVKSNNVSGNYTFTVIGNVASTRANLSVSDNNLLKVISTSGFTIKNRVSLNGGRIMFFESSIKTGYSTKSFTY